MRGGDKGGKAAAAGRQRKKKEKGGERSFVTSLEEMSIRNNLEEQKQRARKVRRDDGEEGDDDDEDEDDDDESDSDEEEDANNGPAFERVQTNSLFGFSQSANGPTIQEKPKKAKGVAGIVKVENPNRAAPSNKVMKAKNLPTDAPVEQQLSRREREALEKEAATARYMKKHLAGETEEAKKDLARLAEVKRRREEAERRKKEEEEAAAEREKSRKKKEVKDDDEPLDARAIKALKPNVLKDKLKERGLSTQGQKKDLIQRLIDYEDERAL
ncbi:hypothetical protein Poli38472_002004 [Pythium oligandrum]|uniref:SAP domain-containing protein n=1 Tax=Pythium oligandrum TaxID=41045 RepID=A0A8K1CX46_PYTOL|nr:hypothetical protein Poli38472_002004 [Pythium oligandrum]|eukprot:TMW69848.1 hypothetical protein Poli38472_002004 [Pythium oligandrum]